MIIDLELEHHARRPTKTDFCISCIGAGFIIRDCHLVAYRNAGYNVVAIASDLPEQAAEVPRLRGIPTVRRTVAELLSDVTIQVVDIAVPPQHQLAIVREAAEWKHLKGILAQKPLATNYAWAESGEWRPPDLNTA